MRLGIASGRPQHMHTTCLAAGAAAQRRLSAVRWLCSQLSSRPSSVRTAAESDPAPTWPYDQQQQQQASTAWPQLEPTPYQQQAAQPLQQQAPLPGQQQYAAYTSYAAAPALPAQQPYAPPQPAGMPPMYNQGPPAAACSTAAGGGGSDDPPGAAPPSTYSPPPADASQQQPQGYMPDGSAYIASAYPPLPVVPYSQGARNMAAVSGVLALPPNMTVNNGRSTKVELIIMPFALPQDKHVQCPIKVQVWGELGAAVYSQLKAVDTVSVVGELRVDYRRTVRTRFGPPITVDAISVSRVDPISIDTSAYVQTYDGIYERPTVDAKGGGAAAGSQPRQAGEGGGGRRGRQSTYGKPAGEHQQQDLAAWRNGSTVQDIAAARGIKRGTAVQHVLEGWGREGGGAQSLDWQRLLGELNVDGQLLEATKQGLQMHSGQRDKQGNIMVKPVRESLLGHPVVGPSLLAREAVPEAGLDLTYSQIRVVREGMAAGAL